MMKFNNDLFTSYKIEGCALPEADGLAAEVRSLLEVAYRAHGILQVRVHLHLQSLKWGSLKKGSKIEMQ